VLVVEDEPDSSDVVCTVLRRAGAIVAAATSAQEALNALQAPGQFDLVVSDIGMPGMDGHALLEAMQSGRADVPAIALSAYARHEDAERSLRAGFRAHLTKPVEEGRLLAAVAAFARR
jgi:CheY-like chemotaxis protein